MQSSADSTDVKFRTPSFRRLVELRRSVKTQSILRCLEYERLATLRLSGRVLDFGGGEKTNYSHLVSSWGDAKSGVVYESANIDPATKPTYLIGIDQDLPCGDALFDSVISLNTFEHIFKVRETLDRINRVMREGADLIFIVPFLFRVHGHPSDYSRGTASYWRELLTECGFESIGIEALSWGPFSTALTVSGAPGPFKNARLQVALLKDFVYFAMKYGQDVVISGKQDAPGFNVPIGYFVTCKKSPVAGKSS